MKVSRLYPIVLPPLEVSFTQRIQSLLTERVEISRQAITFICQLEPLQKGRQQVATGKLSECMTCPEITTEVEEIADYRLARPESFLALLERCLQGHSKFRMGDFHLLCLNTGLIIAGFEDRTVALSVQQVEDRLLMETVAHHPEVAFNTDFRVLLEKI